MPSRLVNDEFSVLVLTRCIRLQGEEVGDGGRHVAAHLQVGAGDRNKAGGRVFFLFSFIIVMVMRIFIIIITFFVVVLLAR